MSYEAYASDFYREHGHAMDEDPPQHEDNDTIFSAICEKCGADCNPDESGEVNGKLHCVNCLAERKE